MGLTRDLQDLADCFSEFEEYKAYAADQAVNKGIIASNGKTAR